MTVLITGATSLVGSEVVRYTSIYVYVCIELKQTLYKCAYYLNYTVILCAFKSLTNLSGLAFLA